MQSKLINFFNYSTGGLFLAMAAALFFSSRVGADIVLPHDPIFMISTRYLFWILSAICLVMALFTLWGEPTLMRTMLIAWLATNLAVYRLGCLWYGGHTLGGYLGSFSDAFGISAATGGTMAEVTLAWLVFGSYFMLLCLWWRKRQNATDKSLKMSCSSCGGHIKFAIQNLGQKIPCPHCQTVIALQTSGTLKMSCVLCNGHIEFPAHALGQKIRCPHCAKSITLLNPA